jgi:hypothetical protein
MSEQYPLELVDDHVIVLFDGRRILLDTGSSMSFGNHSTLRLLGQGHPLQPHHPNITVTQLAG